ncbi:hypothetical protein [Streptomyces sp. NPDC054765]
MDMTSVSGRVILALTVRMAGVTHPQGTATMWVRDEGRTEDGVQAAAAPVPSRSLLVRPSRSPASTSACLTQSRTAVSVRSKSLAT